MIVGNAPGAAEESAMPVYEYICKDCKKEFEVLRAIKDPRTGVACPKCKSQKVERHWTSVFVETTRKS